PGGPWGVQLGGSASEAAGLSAYRQLQQKYASILADREPHIVHHGLARGSMGWARVHVAAESRTSAEKLCANLRRADRRAKNCARTCVHPARAVWCNGIEARYSFRVSKRAAHQLGIGDFAWRRARRRISHMRADRAANFRFRG